MTLLFAFFDILFRMSVLVGIYFVGKAFVKQAKAGFPAFFPEDSWEVERKLYKVYGPYQLTLDLDGTQVVLHEECLDGYNAMVNTQEYYAICDSDEPCAFCCKK
jgi:hypothetical protein